MTVSELIEQLSKFPPDAELWEAGGYAVGRRLARLTPRLETICFHDTTGAPRYESELRFQNRADRWTPAREVVGL